MDDVDMPVFTHRKKEAKQKCVEIGTSPNVSELYFLYLKFTKKSLKQNKDLF